VDPKVTVPPSRQSLHQAMGAKGHNFNLRKHIWRMEVRGAWFDKNPTAL